MSDISDDSVEDDTLLQNFNEAAEHIQNIYTQLKSNDLLDIYALYKQSTVGPCNTQKPGILNVQARTKWSAWNKLGHLARNKAMEMYIKKVLDIDSNFKLNKYKLEWVCISKHEKSSEEEIRDYDKTVFDYVKDNDLKRLRENLNIEEINMLDESGLGLLHWAADRNAIEILEFLLSFGADVNIRDLDKQTPLHYASSCGHLDSIKILLKYNAKKDLEDQDGSNCLDVAFDENVKKMLEN